MVAMDPANLRKGVAEYCALALMRGGDVYGRTLGMDLIALKMLASEGSIYPLLSRLRTAGLVETHWQESAAGPPRRYYGLTATGEEAVREFELVWRSFARNVDLVLSGGSERS
jgi:PadR family transcriptional regulator PadR